VSWRSGVGVVASNRIGGTNGRLAGTLKTEGCNTTAADEGGELPLLLEVDKALRGEVAPVPVPGDAPIGNEEPMDGDGLRSGVGDISVDICEFPAIFCDELRGRLLVEDLSSTRSMDR